MKMPWWKSSSIYQIWPKSFLDTNDDGIGDINGIIKKLDYIKDLGFDAIWISPFYMSPMVDNGYDVSDYYNVNPMFGTNKDFGDLLVHANAKGIKIIIDIVFNHTSDLHEWFLKSKSPIRNKYTDYYIWRNKNEISEENKSISKWEYCSENDKFYFHFFDKRQPDLNWDNPDVLKDCAEILKYWIAKGVSGFRFDVIELIGKEIDLGIYENGKLLHQRIQKVIEIAQLNEDVITIGECWRTDVDTVVQYTNPNNHELSMVFNFQHVKLTKRKIYDKWNAYQKPNLNELKNYLINYLSEVIKKGGWMSNVFENHDLPRMINTYGEPKLWELSSKTLALLQFSLPGTPCVYQGQEIGTKNFNSQDLNDFDDVDLFLKKQFYLDQEKLITKEAFWDGINKLGRDNARRPINWTNGINNGFSNHKPWITTKKCEQNETVEAQLKNNDSILNFYKKLNELRKQKYKDYFTKGEIRLIDSDNNILKFEIELDSKKIMYIANLSDNEYTEKTNFKFIPIILNLEKKALGETINLKPWESILIEIN